MRSVYTGIGVILTLLLCLLGALQFALVSSISSITYEQYTPLSDGKDRTNKDIGVVERKDIRIPYTETRAEYAESDVDILLALADPAWASSSYILRTNACLLFVESSDSTVGGIPEPYCDNTNTYRLELGTAGLQRSVRIGLWRYSEDFSFYIQPSIVHTVWVAICICILGLLAFACLVALRLQKKMVHPSILFAVLGGFSMQALYSVFTPIHLRSYDAEGHIEYITHVAEHFTIPPAQGGWEFFQAPLYYFVTGAWYRLLTEFDVSTVNITESIQALSLLCTAVSFALCIVLASSTFPKNTKSYEQAAYIGLCGFLPSFLFFSTRISNDVLLLPLTIGCFLLLLRWWHTKKLHYWWSAIIVLCYALLTKTSSLPLLGIAGLCLIVRYWNNWQQLLRIGLLSTCIVLITTGGYYGYRFVYEGERSIVGNTLNDQLGVQNTILHLTVFSPAHIASYPFNDSWTDDYRRQYFWEYFYKSLFVGEWSFGPYARITVTIAQVLGLALVLIGVLGFLERARRHLLDDLPWILTFSLLLATIFSYRLLVPYGPNQDIRFVPLLLIAGSYFVTQGLNLLHISRNRMLQGLVSMFLFSCAAFIICIL